jgi:LysR family transcriptional activator of nhaA
MLIYQPVQSYSSCEEKYKAREICKKIGCFYLIHLKNRCIMMIMEWLNYHHLLYFWTVAREGSVSRACRQLNLAQPTISGQIRSLEDSLGEKLFIRSGRNLVLTEVGRVVYRYADDIFSMGRELLDTLKDRPTGRPVRLAVGVADVLPKLIAYRLLAPALSLPDPVQMVCREDKPERLLAELAVHGLDIVLSDAPVDASVRVRAFSHLLGECGVSLFATPRQAVLYRKGFPGSLEGAPFLLPTDNTILRRSLDQWFATQGIRPRVVGEFDDRALLKAFGQAGAGIFPAPAAIEKEVQRRYGVSVVGRIETVRERFYVISVERKLKHPAVVAITEAARGKLFG